MHQVFIPHTEKQGRDFWTLNAFSLYTNLGYSLNPLAQPQGKAQFDHHDYCLQDDFHPVCVCVSSGILNQHDYKYSLFVKHPWSFNIAFLLTPTPTLHGCSWFKIHNFSSPSSRDVPYQIWYMINKKRHDCIFRKRWSKVKHNGQLYLRWLKNSGKLSLKPLPSFIKWWRKIRSGKFRWNLISYTHYKKEKISKYIKM